MTLPLEDSYVCFIHSDYERDLRTMCARTKWRLEYRRQRLLRRGIIELDLTGEWAEIQDVCFRLGIK